MAETWSSPCKFNDLPNEIVEKVLSYLSYEEISALRIVSRRFDNISQLLLNQGFSKADKFHALCQKEIKAQLPRRESERRCHPLARHVDILSATETRMSLLGMTYMKYIDLGLCCFIPGKVVDEIFRILHLLRAENKPPRAHELLQELRDISSMAMEHFDEKIVPRLKRLMTPNKMDTFGDSESECTSSFNPLHMSLPTPQLRLPSIRQDMGKMQQQVRVCAVTLVSVKKHMTDCKNKNTDHTNKITKLERNLTELKKSVTKQNKRLNAQDDKINEQNKKLLEYDQKFADILAEISSLHGRKLSLPEAVMPSSSSKISHTEDSIVKKGLGTGGISEPKTMTTTKGKGKGRKRKLSVEHAEGVPSSCRPKRKL